MNHQDARLIDAEQIEELDRLLEPLGESVMEVGVLDGYLTASLLAPEMPTDEDLLPFIFDEEGDPEKVPDNPRILELIDMRKREIAAALNAGGGLDPLEILHGDAVSSHFCQLGLGQLPFLSVVQNIQTDFDPYVVMADVHTITSVPIVNNTPLKIFNLIVLKYK